MLTSVERLLFVRGVPIFHELRDDFLVRVASVMDELSFPANHTIVTQGEEGRSLYIIVSGLVRVHIGDGEGEGSPSVSNRSARGTQRDSFPRQGHRILADLIPGQCFGEMSLFDAEPRSASVTTRETCHCLVLTQLQLYDAIDETPGIAINIIRLLSRRIRELNNKLNTYEVKNAAPDFSRT